jgi:hypothetical protein
MAQSISQEAVVNTGLPGATAASRYAGATASGAPTTGTFAVGDFIVDQSGAMYVCTVAGTPGTWQVVGTPPTAQIAGKNKIINGDFGVWQRGTSFTNPGNGVYTSDHWRMGIASGTVSRQTFTPGTAPVAGYESAYYINTTITANSQNYEILQPIEDVRTFAGQTATLSFWARSTVGAQLCGVALYQNFGTGGSPSSLNPATFINGSTGNSSYTPTSTWTRYTFTFSVPSIAGKTIGTNNDSYLWARVWQFSQTTTNTSIDIWGVQLEAGPTATEFTTAAGSIGGELALCQRYYQRFSSAYQYAIIVPGMFGQTSTTGQLNFLYPVTMRTIPTSIDFSNLAWYGGGGGPTSISNVVINGSYITSQGANLTVTSTGLTNGSYYVIIQSAVGSAYLGLNAEL